MKIGDSIKYRDSTLLVNNKEVGEITNYDVCTGTFTWKRFSFWQKITRLIKRLLRR